MQKEHRSGGISDEQRSVARQIEHGRAYAARKGWMVRDAHIYVDDGISGAEFANRPGFVRLMAALSPRAPFQALIMSEESRLGREAIETAYALKQLITAGVRVFFYLEDRERTFDSPTDKLLMSVTAFADELEREKARQRTYDAMERKAKAGHVTGGRVFGYDNLEVLGPDGQRSHVERRINEAEAVIVRRIFELCADGAGLTRITKALNEDGCPAPRSQQGRPRGWVHSTVREVLLREMYRGIVVWNQTRKRDRWGRKHQHRRPEIEWLRVPASHLQIVSDDTWRAAHDALTSRRQQYNQFGKPITGDASTRGRTRRDADGSQLLTGFARCARCGGGLSVQTRQHGGQRVPLYGCLSHWKRGPSICGNRLVGRTETIDAEVLETLRDDVMRPAVVQEAIRLALAELAPAKRSAGRRRLETELAAVRRECERLADAIARGGPIDVLLERLQARQTRRVTLQGELAAVHASAPHASPERLEERLRAKLTDWRGLLMRNVTEGRAVLRTLLIGPLRFTPLDDERQRGYAFEGLIALDRLVAGSVDLPHVWRPQRDSIPLGCGEHE